MEKIILAPIVGAALLIIIINTALVTIGATHPSPNNPWESGLVVEAWRYTVGLPLYTDFTKDHATQMYGPLMVIIMGCIFHYIGPSIYVGRIISLFCALTATTIIARVLTKKKTKILFMVAWSLIFGINSCVGNYFVETRPDMASLLFSIFALIFFFQGWENNNRKKYLLGVCFLLIAFFFKQTSAIIAFIPLTTIFVKREMPREKSEIFLLLLPILTLLLIILILRIFFPMVFFYMITVPAQYHISLSNVLRFSGDFLNFLGLFYAFFFDWFINDTNKFTDKRLPWLVACCFLTVPSGIIFRSKFGGDINSLLPSLISLMSFPILRLPRIFQYLYSNLNRHWRRCVVSVIVGLMMLTIIFSNARRAFTSSNSHVGDKNYQKVISLIKPLPGKVICPDDPTIPLFGKGYIGRSIYLEFDAIKHPKTIPVYLLSEINSANFVLQVRHVGGWYKSWITNDFLKSQGFSPVELDSLRNTSYTLWQKNNNSL